MEQPQTFVAANLRKIREGRGLSLDQLAELTGVSKSMLRQVETGKSSPSISTLWKIANGLRVSFTSLLTQPPVRAEIKSFTGKPPLTAESAHYRLYPLIPFDPQHGTETYYVEIDPGTSFTGEPHKGQVTEHFFVFSGVLEVVVRDRQYRAGDGEYLRFLADCSHTYRSTGEAQVRAIMQLTYGA